MILPIEVKLTPAQLAEAFCEMDDDAQAQFFVECAKIMDTWGVLARQMQSMLIGNHLRDCECSTLQARELVEMIADSMKPG